MIKAYNAAFPVLVFLLIAWPRYWLFPMPGGFAISPFSVLTLAMLAIFAFTLTDARVRLYVATTLAQHRALFLLYLAWTIWRLLCDALGQTPPASLATTLRGAVYGESILLLGLIALSRQATRATIPSVLLLTILVATLIGAYEWSVQRTFADIMGISFAGLDESAMFSASRQAIAFYRDGAYRAASLFSHSIVFAQYAGAMAPPALHACRYGHGGTRLLGALALCCIPIVMLISGARSGLVVLIAALSAYALLTLLGRRATPKRLLASLTALALAALLLASPLQSLTGLLIRGDTAAEQMSTNARAEMLSNGLRAIQDRPLFGYGDGRSPDIAGLTGRHNIRTIDNLYLSAAVDFGVVGLALFLGFLAAAIATMAKGLATPDRNQQSAYLATALAILVGQTVITIPDNMAIIYLLLGLVVTRSSSKPATAA
jgi:O-antigen ligase